MSDGKYKDLQCAVYSPLHYYQFIAVGSRELAKQINPLLDEVDPFFLYKLKFQRTEREFLLEEEIVKA